MTERTVADVFEEWKRRRKAVLNAVTVDFEQLYGKCDPKNEAMALYGNEDGTWTVTSDLEDLPPLLPEPTIGINYPRNGLPKSDWLAIVAANSDSWLLRIMFFKAARFNRAKRLELFERINSIPTILDVLCQIYPDIHHKLKFNLSNLTSLQNDSSGNVNEDQSINYDDDDGDQVMEENRQVKIKSKNVDVTQWKDGDGEPCPFCQRHYKFGEFWIQCDFCNKWICGKCSKINEGKAQKINTWKCTICACQKQ